jgi:hypothetical protein
VPFHVGPGCRLAVAGGLKKTAVAVDGNYTIYGTATGVVEVYEGDKLVYVKSAGAPVLSASSAGLAYETPAGASSLIISPVRVVTNCRSWTAYLERSVVYRLPQVTPGRGGPVRPHIKQDRGRRHLRHLSEAVLRQVDLAVSLRGVDGRGLGGAASSSGRGGLREAGACGLGGGGAALRVA